VLRTTEHYSHYIGGIDITQRASNAVLLAFDFHPSEGGIQTLMQSMVTAETGISWVVLTREAEEKSPKDKGPLVYRTAIRPQLRMIDRIWLKSRWQRHTVEELIAFQTRRPLVALSRKSNARFLFADQLCSALSVRRTAKQLRIQWGLWVHGKELLRESPTTSSLLIGADLVLANSAFTKRLAVARGAREQRTVIVYPSVDINRFIPPPNREEIRGKLGLRDSKVLISVGHLMQRKGHEHVIRSLPKIRFAYPKVIYLIVGRGPNELPLRTLVQELGVADLVRFCGRIPDLHLPLYYQAADIHVMPSTCDGDVEGFGISFIEAAACGTPSIGSRSGGIPDAIVDGVTGYLIEPGNVDGLTKRIVAMLSNEKLRDQMGSAARETATTRFSGKAFAQALINAFRQTVLSE